MVKNILNQLVIAAGQWQQFGDIQYEREFERLLGELQKKTGLDKESAVAYLMTYLGDKKVAA